MLSKWIWWSIYLQYVWQRSPVKFARQLQNSFKHVPPLKHGLEQNENATSQLVPVKSTKQLQTGLGTPFN